MHQDASWTVNGQNAIRVAPSGKIGVIWRNSNYGNQDASLYLQESTDGGATWTPDAADPIFPTTAVNGFDGFLAPGDAFDFFYDDNENPMILMVCWVIRWQDDAEGNPSFSYFPSLPSIMAVTRDGFHTITSTFLATTEYQVDSLLMRYPIGTNIQEGSAVLQDVTIARSNDPNVFSIFYTALQGPDTTQTGIESDETPIIGAFGSIWMQTTEDGGESWGEPTAFVANDTTAADVDKRDYRWPMVSSFNPSKTYQTSFAVDSVAGPWVTLGNRPGWDLIQWYSKLNGEASVHSSANPTTFTLAQNYPNPFNPTTKINFTLKQRDNVTITVADMLGRTVATIQNGVMNAGSYNRTFDAAKLPSGVYNYTLRTSTESMTRTMVLAK